MTNPSLPDDELLPFEKKDAAQEKTKKLKPEETKAVTAEPAPLIPGKNAPLETPSSQTYSTPQVRPQNSASGSLTQIPVVDGKSAPVDLSQEFRLATMYVKSGMLPTRFKTPEAALTAIHFAKEHFPNTPLTALRQIAVINGTPCLFGDLPLAIVQRSRQYGGKTEYFLDDKGNKICVENNNMNSLPQAAVCLTKRIIGLGHVDEHSTIFTMTDAKRAGLLDSPTWKKYPADMLRYRARGRNLKDQFADCLNGVGQGEFDHGVMVDDVAEKPGGADIARELNEVYCGGGSVSVPDLQEKPC
jgi:hypothetical protein